MNTKHKEVGLQSKLKLIVSKVSGLFTGSADEVISKTLSVLNTVAGNDSNIGFYSRISGVGRVLGNVIELDLNIPLMNRSIDSIHENIFNRKVANALVDAFGAVNVGYLSPTPVRITSVVVTADVESDTPTLDVHKALNGVATNVVVTSR